MANKKVQKHRPVSSQVHRVVGRTTCKFRCSGGFDRDFQSFGRTRPLRRVVYATIWLTCVWIGACIGQGSAFAQVSADTSSALKSLKATQITLAVDGQTLRKTLKQLLQTTKSVGNETVDGTHWSLWLQKEIDGGQEVSLTANQSDAAIQISELAERLRLGWFVLPGVVLVGEPEWIEATLANLPWDTPSATSRDRTDDIWIRWSAGTPALAVLLAALEAPSNETDNQVPFEVDLKVPEGATCIPHDLWTNGELKRVDRRLAISLILAQFGLSLSPNASLSKLHIESERVDEVNSSDGEQGGSIQAWMPDSMRQPFTVWYPSVLDSNSIRSALPRDLGSSARGNLNIRKRKNLLFIETNASTHRHIFLVMAKQRAMPKAGNPVNTDAATYDLKLVNKPALEVLRQFAAASGKKLRTVGATEFAGERLVSLDATGKTLEQLSRQVATSVGLVVEWTKTEVIVTVP